MFSSISSSNKKDPVPAREKVTAGQRSYSASDWALIGAGSEDTYVERLRKEAKKKIYGIESALFDAEYDLKRVRTLEGESAVTSVISAWNNAKRLYSLLDDASTVASFEEFLDVVDHAKQASVGLGAIVRKDLKVQEEWEDERAAERRKLLFQKAADRAAGYTPDMLRAAYKGPSHAQIVARLDELSRVGGDRYVAWASVTRALEDYWFWEVSTLLEPLKLRLIEAMELDPIFNGQFPDPSTWSIDGSGAGSAAMDESE